LTRAEAYEQTDVKLNEVGLGPLAVLYFTNHLSKALEQVREDIKHKEHIVSTLCEDQLNLYRNPAHPHNNNDSKNDDSKNGETVVDIGTPDENTGEVQTSTQASADLLKELKKLNKEYVAINQIYNQKLAGFQTKIADIEIASAKVSKPLSAEVQALVALLEAPPTVEQLAEQDMFVNEQNVFTVDVVLKETLLKLEKEGQVVDDKIKEQTTRVEHLWNELQRDGLELMVTMQGLRDKYGETPELVKALTELYDVIMHDGVDVQSQLRMLLTELRELYAILLMENTFEDMSNALETEQAAGDFDGSIFQRVRACKEAVEHLRLEKQRRSEKHAHAISELARLYEMLPDMKESVKTSIRFQMSIEDEERKGVLMVMPDRSVRIVAGDRSYMKLPLSTAVTTGLDLLLAQYHTIIVNGKQAFYDTILTTHVPHKQDVPVIVELIHERSELLRTIIAFETKAGAKARLFFGRSTDLEDEHAQRKIIYPKLRKLDNKLISALERYVLAYKTKFYYPVGVDVLAEIHKEIESRPDHLELSGLLGLEGYHLTKSPEVVQRLVF
jgi:hypothetical protein